MAVENRWVDEEWHRDWLFWAGAVVAVVAFVLRLTMGNGPWWWDLAGLLLGFAVTVGVLGFARTVVRTYRAE